MSMRRGVTVRSGGLLVALLLLAGRGQALPLHVAVDAGTEFPVDVGARLTVEVPLRLQFAFALGAMPSGYVGVINGTLVAFKVYDDTTASLINAALQNSLLMHLQFGWRPFETQGFYFHAGYLLGTLGGGLSGADVVSAVGKTPLGNVNRSDSFKVSTFVQGVEAEIGWVWNLPFSLQIRAALGAMHLFSSASTITYTGTVNRPAVKTEVAKLEQQGQQYLDDTITTYVYSPMATLTVGWAIF
jgi:hypothetical protein